VSWESGNNRQVTVPVLFFNKFFNKKKNRDVKWESGNNRQLTVPAGGGGIKAEFDKRGEQVCI